MRACLCAVGAVQAKRMVFKEVMDFSAQHTQAGREMQVQDLSALQATLKSKLQASQVPAQHTRTASWRPAPCPVAPRWRPHALL